MQFKEILDAKDEILDVLVSAARLAYAAMVLENRQEDPIALKLKAAIQRADQSYTEVGHG